MIDRPARTGRAIVVLIAVLAAGAALAAVAFVAMDEDPSNPPSAPNPSVEDALGIDCAAWDRVGGDAPTGRPDLTPLADDDGLVRGTLPNGVRYLIRENGRPGQSASLGLAVDAGAAIEDDDQHGAAHFLEHMLFNGTARYPGNELERVLAGLGVDFGPDLNAFTTEDATVYRLEVSNDPADIDTGLDVLLEWATQATLDPSEVDAERGVVLEELRNREHPDARFFLRLRDLALAGTRYEGHDVLGTEESLEALTAESLRRFYEDWYRPDLLTVVAVGDFDAAAVEEEITRRFGRIAVPASDARQRPTLDTAPPTAPRFGSYVDDELAGTSAEILFTHPADRVVSVDDLQGELLEGIGLSVLDERLNDDADSGVVPFYEVDTSIRTWVREFRTAYLSVDAEPELLDDALAAVVAELVRVRRHGVTEAEVDRAVERRRAVALAARRGAPSTQDRDLLFRLVDAALAMGPTTPVDVRATAELSLLDQITADDVTASLAALTSCGSMAVQAGVPSEYEDALPDEARIEAILRSAVEPGSVDDRASTTTPPESLMAAPDPVAPIRRSQRDAFGGVATVLEFPNGATVVIHPSDIDAGRFLLRGAGRGGLATLTTEADIVNGRLASALVGDSGVGDLDAVALGRVLDGVDAWASTAIDVADERVWAGGAGEDLDVAMQLLHLRISSPRIDPGAVATLRGERRLTAERPERRADTAIRAAFDRLLYGDDLRYRHGTTARDLELLDPARALAVHEDRFGDVGDFTFVLVGDVDPGRAEELAGRYLGTLPGTDRVETATHTPPPVPDGPVDEIVRAGSGQQATVRIVHHVEVTVDPVLRDRAEAMVDVLALRLRDRLREELGATYGVETWVSADDRTGRTQTGIEVSGDPDRIDEVATEVRASVAALATDGPSDDEVSRALEPMLRDLAFIDNPLIADTWLYAFDHPAQELEDSPAGAEPRLTGVDGGVVRDLVARLLPPTSAVQVVQIPAG